MEYESLQKLEIAERFYADEVQKLHLKQQIDRHKQNIERMKKDPSYDPLAEALKRL